MKKTAPSTSIPTAPAIRTGGLPGSSGGIVPAFGTNFHTSYMPVVAQGCTGDISCETGQTVLGACRRSCDVGNGVCRTDGVAKDAGAARPGAFSIRPSATTSRSCRAMRIDPGHAMGGAAGRATSNGALAARSTVHRRTDAAPDRDQVSVFVFEDDFPLNGEHDAGGGVDVLAPNEPGLGGFNIIIVSTTSGGSAIAAGQMTYDMFNMPLSNTLAGTIDPATGKDACPISANSRTGFDGVTSPTGITGMIPVCPKYEVGWHNSVSAGGPGRRRQPAAGLYGVVATPGRRPHRARRRVAADQHPGRRMRPRCVRQGRASRATSRSMVRPDTTWRSVSPIPRSSTTAKPGVCARPVTDCTHTRDRAR